jgi:hypothetical protein
MVSTHHERPHALGAIELMGRQSQQGKYMDRIIWLRVWGELLQ